MMKFEKGTLKGFAAGTLVTVLTLGTILPSSAATMKEIKVAMGGIKIYVDGNLKKPTDVNGNVVEPMIYDGTTYLPVRGAANLADMQVTWDGNSKSVYLWDEQVPEGTYFLEVCPPYDTSRWVYTYLASEGQSFDMAGEKYSNGMVFKETGRYALFNLNSKYSTIECTIGHTSYLQREKTVSFIVDGKVVQEVTLESECLPKKVSIPVQYGLQLKIVSDDYVGIGDMTVR